ncbi:hypothetical protein Q5H92_05860 [Hymenobacter sp. M29]|uniref:Uncharacterized protein n=1 Tax=Hymenobacter mellowenesis TaxID=3063995 RepID=A0ABT9A7Q6_9BACT|nr:hypothetical protein [Hymenobacter sp. M29]MDO7845874.1 hypothetical protein [Hymenobacter sp. M29]
MKIHHLSLLALLFSAGVAHAQQDAAAQTNLNALAAGAPAVVPRGTADGLKGSPYADNRWLLAQITLANNLPLAPVPLKYDVLDHRLLMRAPARPKDSLQLDDARVLQFVLNEPATPLSPARQRTFRRFAEAPAENHKRDYVEVLHQGRYTLLKHYLKKLNKANYQGAYSTDSHYDEIEDKSVYYLLTPDARLVPVKLALKPLQGAAPALAAALKTAADAQKPKTDAEWTAVFAAADPAPAK